MSGKLTEEQLRRIEENKRKALAKRAGKLHSSTNLHSVESTPVTCSNKIQDGPKLSCGSTSDFRNQIQKVKTGIGPTPTVHGSDNAYGGAFTLKNSGNSINKTQDGLASTKGPVANISRTQVVVAPAAGSIRANDVMKDKGSPVVMNNVRVEHTSDLQKSSVNKTGGIVSLPEKPSVSTKLPLGSGENNYSAASSVNSNLQSKTVVSKAKINYDQIEQNRLKALAKRAEKLSKSPGKSLNPSSNFSESNKMSEKIGDKSGTLATSFEKQQGTFQQNVLSGENSGNIKLLHKQQTLSSAVTSNNNTSLRSVKSNLNCAGPSSRNQDTFAQSSTNSESSNSGQNIFSKFTGTPVKGGCFLVSRDRFEVKVGYSAPLIELFKTMKTKLYDAVSKKWSFKLSEYNSFMIVVRNLHPAVDIEPLPRAITTTFSAQIKGENPPKHAPIADLSRVEQSLVNSLMSFQREGVNYGIYKNGRVLIADDMGLGKTIQAICLSCYYRTEWPLLVVVPSSVRFDWAQNFLRWVPSLDPQSVNVVVTGKDSCTSGLINILSYDLMSRKADILKKKRFQIVIMDESHLLKNYKTARCKAAIPLLQNARRVLLLSGTPALSRPSELFTQIDAVCPFLFKFHDFGVRYCAGTKLPWGWDYSGSSNMEELQILLEEKIMIRRLKKDVLTELPDKIRQMILLDPSSIKISKDLKSASEVMASGNLKKMEERGALLEFFHKSGSAKMKAIKSYVEDLLDSEKKFLIFAHHGDVLDGIEETVKAKIDLNYMRIDGKTNSEQRNFLCKKFQLNEDVKVAILSITAANAGLNLSSACLVVFAELFWNPGILVQAEDRAHRIGQQDMVNVQYLVARGTSDDHIWPMIQNKLDVLGKAGLSKDNFSSAETTRLRDQRQEEITKFLEESFCDDGVVSHVADNNGIFEEEFESSPKKAFKQSSILKYTSPAKDIETFRSSSTPPKEKKPKGLFKYFTPEKKSGSDVYNNPSENCATYSTFEGHSSRPDEKGQDDDLEKFLLDSDEEWEGNDDGPIVKKRRT
ncbi:SWI/SNF-related matrix-associated actin-dependent regulator of chromatin subfamily A-like protein 1 isoform X2 [Mercenaria mercenaria]|nr:SWI/SNF-related matrix-associated actin-dependent regulator of chromatin subfamily A-like protein 1 isoform X2 [Mercenaria mercenaria]XP_053374734.1 SWI/SNF-related matrix-associated actin-dependent regulator of chromatin subfamily A-like protein 1 isoform X2 [Mercenaria mercenaria]XP_053374735.1 SWI/SNF-related matrix-associated actin-dependent regulator of chromatin subfamily A-like protein 1 isoform X2 [Mercenaria mercenaria]